MNSPGAYLLAADLILVVHALFVAFVVLGLACILIGGWRGWSWVRRPVFRLLHLLAIGVVVAQAWLGALCPLTEWESALRARAGGATYPGSFISYWLQYLLYWQAPEWVFTTVYTLFGGLVLASWLAIPPRRSRTKVESGR
jgi:hypothetical protein